MLEQFALNVVVRDDAPLHVLTDEQFCPSNTATMAQFDVVIASQ